MGEELQRPKCGVYISTSAYSYHYVFYQVCQKHLFTKICLFFGTYSDEIFFVVRALEYLGLVANNFGAFSCCSSARFGSKLPHSRTKTFQLNTLVLDSDEGMKNLAWGHSISNITGPLVPYRMVLPQDLLGPQVGN